ncbi:MAG: penicillin-binding protein 2 [Candidatus Omnitrophica bacterium]|nr:penicillin-binding protein 2 [Candidatus Omnitrophota bacterium]
MYIKNYICRRKVIFFVFFILFLVCLSRLFFIQCFRNTYLSQLARKQQNLFIHLEPYRGTIFDRNLNPLAINLPSESLYAVPREINNKEEAIRKLLPILKTEEGYLKNKLSSNKLFIWLARKLSYDAVEKIKGLNLNGLYFIQESRRVYPNFHLASHLIGFAGLDNKGLEGIELYYDQYLVGTSGWCLLLRDGRQEKLGLRQKLVLPSNGYNLVMTIDEVIQFIAERELDRIMKEFRPKAASAVIMDPFTGEILALANRPTFDLNQTSQTDSKIRRNRAITDYFEPGSVFKIVTATAALEESRFSEEDRLFCENGAYKISRHVLHDHTPHGWLSFREVFEKSSNIGVTKIAQELGEDILYSYIKKFGFGVKAGIDLPGEISGAIKDPSGWSATSIAAIPIGQEVGVTALQLIGAISAISNKGRLMKPYVVREIQDEYGQTIKHFYPQVLSTVMSEQTALRLSEILVGVVENGTGKMARIKGLRLAGKTGTAQKLESNGSYSHSKFFALFIGFAPAENPRLAVVIAVDEPQPSYFGGVVCAPAFRNICDNALRYLGTQELPVSNEAETYGAQHS